MPPKKANKNTKKNQSQSDDQKAKPKNQQVQKSKKNNVTDNSAHDNEEEVSDQEVDFFDRDSYDAFTSKYGIELLSNYYVNDDIHKEDAIVANEQRITSEIMTQAEYTRVVSERAKQIENGSPIFIQLRNEHDPITIAEREIRQKKCPLKIMRYLSKNIREEWEVNEMIIPFGINLN